MANVSNYLHANVLSGQDNRAAGENSGVVGTGNIASAHSSFFVGHYAEDHDDPNAAFASSSTMFAVGAGTNSGNRLTVFRVTGEKAYTKIPLEILVGNGGSIADGLILDHNDAPNSAYSPAIVLKATSDSPSVVTGKINAFTNGGSEDGIQYDITQTPGANPLHDFRIQGSRKFWVGHNSAGTIGSTVFVANGLFTANNRIKLGPYTSTSTDPTIYLASNTDTGIGINSAEIKVQTSNKVRFVVRGTNDGFFEFYNENNLFAQFGGDNTVNSAIFNPNQETSDFIVRTTASAYAIYADEDGVGIHRLPQAGWTLSVLGRTHISGGTATPNVNFLEIAAPEATIPVAATYGMHISIKAGDLDYTSLDYAGNGYGGGNVTIEAGAAGDNICGGLGGSVYIKGGAGSQLVYSFGGSIYLQPGSAPFGSGSVYVQNAHFRVQDGNIYQTDTNSGIYAYDFYSYQNGSASNPVFSRSSDAHTGMFFAGNDQIAFSTGGSERLRITSTKIYAGAGVVLGAANVNSQDVTIATWYGSENDQFGMTQHQSSVGIIAYNTGGATKYIRTFAGRRPNSTNPTNWTMQQDTNETYFDTNVRVTGSHVFGFVDDFGVYMRYDGDSWDFWNGTQWLVWYHDGVAHFSSILISSGFALSGYNTSSSFLQFRSWSDADTGINFYAAGDMRMYAAGQQGYRLYYNGANLLAYYSGDYHFFQSTRNYIQGTYGYLQSTHTYVNTSNFYFNSTPAVAINSVSHGNYEPIVSDRGTSGQAYYVSNGATTSTTLYDYYGNPWNITFVNGICTSFYEV